MVAWWFQWFQAVQRIFAAAFVSRPAYPAVRPSSEPPGKFLAWFSKPGRGFGGSMELVRSLILTASAVQRIFAAAFVSRPAYPAVRPSWEPPGKFLAWYSKPGFRPAQVPHGMWKHRLDTAGDGETTETIEQPLRNH